MLMLTLDIRVDPLGKPFPPHLGGILHGFVEGAVKNHAPHLLPVLRPQGPNQLAEIMIQAPPYAETIHDHLRFGVVLYGTSSAAWPVILRALIEQQLNRLNSRRIQITEAWLQYPATDAVPLMEAGCLLDDVADHTIQRDARELADLTPCAQYAQYFRISFHTPLLLASRKAQRHRGRLRQGLPWPSLGSMLDSIATRLRTLEPELSAALAVSRDWRAPGSTRKVDPMTSPDSPAQQMHWEYTATPRTAQSEALIAPNGTRTLFIPGIVGDLIYPAMGMTHEYVLLYWGQWLGVGQKTTMGCGCYRLTHQ